MTAKDDPRLEGRHPEFARMSLKPGIGGDFTWEIASTMLEFNLEKREGDVPSSLAHGTSRKGLGRYLTQRLRKQIGRDEKAPRNAEREAEMLAVYERSKTSPEVSVKKILVKDGDQKVRQMEARQKIFRKDKPI